MRRYWPGRRYVDLVGTTMIDFGGNKDYPVRAFAPRLRALRRLYRKPIVLAEANTEAPRRRRAGCGDLRPHARADAVDPRRLLVAAPEPRQGAAAGTGIVDWDVQRVPAGG